jgi:hypothetical protein
MVLLAANVYQPALDGNLVKMNIYRGFQAAFFFCFVDMLRSFLFSLLFLSPPLLHLKLAGARADTADRNRADYLNMIARDITISKSPEAILPGVNFSSESSYLASDEVYVEEEFGINADNEHSF